MAISSFITKESKGYINGILSGVSFGLIPLFSIPVINAGMNHISILVYRFFFGSLSLLLLLLIQHINIKISKRECLHIALLSLFYNGTAISTLECYKYISSGIATSLVYTDPIWCAIICFLFLGNKFSSVLFVSLIMATVGVMALVGLFTEDATFHALGVFWGLTSGLTYALYLIFMPRLRLHKIPSLKLTFYVFFIGMFELILYHIIRYGAIESINDSEVLINLVLLGLIPTALSNVCVTTSLKYIDSTIVAILGAFEPLTAIAIGMCVLGEPLSIGVVVGAILIITAVGLLVLRKNQS